MKKLVFCLLCLFCFSLDVKAIHNNLLDSEIATSGNFFSINGWTKDTWTSKGYKVYDTSSTGYIMPYAQPSTNFALGQHGGALTQCGVGIANGHKYMLTYYFFSENNSYIWPGYSTWKNFPVMIGTHPTNTDYITPLNGYYNSEVQSIYYSQYSMYVFSYSIFFTATSNATCVGSTFTVNGGGDTEQYPFAGYKIQDLGTEELTTDEINSALSSSFNELKTSIDNSTNSINNNINSSTKSINSNIDDMKEKQDETNNLISSDSEDVESSSCGILCKLKNIVIGIVELPSKLVNLLIDALKSLFIPTSDQLYEIINDASELSENFGFVGQSMDFFINLLTSLLGLVNHEGCIELPEFTIGATSLFDSHTFWEEQNVCLSNNAILSNNIETIRSFTDIILVAMFVSWAASKFFSILSKNGEEDIVDYSDRDSAVPTVTHYKRVNGTVYKE